MTVSVWPIAIVRSVNWSALGAFVKSRREELGMSIKSAALTADVSVSWWRQLEAGERRLKSGEMAQPNVRGDLLGRAARTLNVSLADLRALLESE